MNRIITLIMLIPICIFAFNAPEYIDTEVLVDEESVSFDEDVLYDFFAADNYVMISGGCYNVEWLAMGDLMKLNIPLSKSVHFTYMKMSLSRIENAYDLFGFGLSWTLNKWVNIGFLANPVFEKKDADISLNLGFKGLNTRNQLLIRLTNLDNNYAHKNDNSRYPFPRIYTAPYIPFNSTSYFPIDIFFTSAGYIKTIDFFFMLKTGTPFSADYYYYDEILGDVYTHSADSSVVYMTACLMNNTMWKDSKLYNSIFVSSMLMDNAYRDSILDISEHDVRINAGYSGRYTRGMFSVPLSLEYAERTITSESMEQYRLNSFVGGAGLCISPGNWDIELKEIFNIYESRKSDDSLDLMQTRLQLSVKYHFSDYAYFLARKGFETDPYDIRNGGIFFFYDKMYVQFVCDIDGFVKEQSWIDL